MIEVGTSRFYLTRPSFQVDYSNSDRLSFAAWMEELSDLTANVIMQKTKQVQAAKPVSQEICTLCLLVQSLLRQNCRSLRLEEVWISGIWFSLSLIEH